MLYCGLDLHAKESFLYVIDQRGRQIVSRRVPTQARCFKEWLGPLVRRRLKSRRGGRNDPRQKNWIYPLLAVEVLLG